MYMKDRTRMSARPIPPLEDNPSEDENQDRTQDMDDELDASAIDKLI